MKQWIVYEVVATGDEIDTQFYTTKDEAISAARKAVKIGGCLQADAYAVWIRTDLRKRPLHVALLNRSKWMEGRDLIASFPEKGEPAAGDAAKEGE